MTLSALGITVTSGAAALMSAYFLAIQVRLGQTLSAILSATRADDPTAIGQESSRMCASSPFWS